MTYRILLLDDEPAICEITAILLKKLGYDAVITSKGEDTLEAYKGAMDEGNRFDVVILDLSVPRGTGWSGGYRCTRANGSNCSGPRFKWGCK